MAPTPAPPGTLRRKVEYFVVGLACIFGVVVLLVVVYWLGFAVGLWGNAGY